jgi:hypothetical protein
MKFCVPLLACLLFYSAASLAFAEDAAPEKKPGMFSRLLDVFRSSDGKSGKLKWKELLLTMKLEPLPLKLGETRQLKVTLQLTNDSKKFVQLEFPTTQRVEVLVKRPNGTLVEQWSEDHSFTSEPSLVTINPNERLEYTVSVATRDMAAGEPFVIEAFFPNYEPLRVEQTIIPEK